MTSANRQIYIGTSGWSYDWWREIFYPSDLPKTRWLSFYASRFRTVEVNNSFYRLPSRTVFEKWSRSVGDGFLFAVKASRYITHTKKLKEPVEPWSRLLEATSGLGNKLGPILFEFQPSWRKNYERLADFLKILPEGLDYAFEFRHPSWFARDTYDLLAGKGASLVIADSPRFPRVFEETSDLIFVRFHGGRLLYGSEYSDRELAWWARFMLDAERRGKRIFAYFNNDAFGFAPKNAAQLESLLLGEEKAA
ncbi:MAG: DUF72 domain-containing protein [Chloroflexi bacterium]|nr:DUF72 domain-containing protein [Chloroflexota bacterium]